MAPDMMRDAPFGQFMRFVTRNRVFKYPEEMPDFVVPEKFLLKKDDAQRQPDDGQASGPALSPEERNTAGRESVDAQTLVNSDRSVRRTFETDQEKQDRRDRDRASEDDRRSDQSPRQNDEEANSEEAEQQEKRRQEEREKHPGTTDPKKALEEDLIDKYQYLVDFDEGDQYNPK